jgi:phenylacetate-CoA ligase
MEFFDKAEIWTREELEAEQLRRLRAALEHALRSPFYSKRLGQAGISPEKIKTLDDLRRLPFTDKNDLRAAYPCGLVSVPHTELVRLHASSGTTGSPVAIHYTREDLDAWASLMARSFFSAGVRPTDVFQNIAGYGLFTGGLGIHAGAERLGCLTIPSGTGNTPRQIKFLQDFKVTVIHIIPSYAMYLAGKMEESGLDPRSLSLRKAMIGAEPHSEETRRKIENILGVDAYNSYGLSEMNGPGVAFECSAKNGMHVWEDAYIFEIIDPDTLEPLPDGETGELVMSTINRRGMPILRYRTRDLTRILPGPCPCGRAHRRIDRILGRSDDMFIIKGCNVYPMQIEQVLMVFPEVGNNYRIILQTIDDVDEMHVQVEINDSLFVEDMRALTALQKAIARKMQNEILVTPKIDLVQRNSLPVSEGKATRVLDQRPE